MAGRRLGHAIQKPLCHVLRFMLWKKSVLVNRHLTSWSIHVVAQAAADGPQEAADMGLSSSSLGSLY